MASLLQTGVGMQTKTCTLNYRALKLVEFKKIQNPDLDYDTERFLAFSQSEMRKFRYKVILANYVSKKEITKSYSKWNIADSFLMSSQQFRHFLRASGVNLSEGEQFKVFDIGQGSGTILKTLGQGSKSGQNSELIFV